MARRVFYLSKDVPLAAAGFSVSEGASIHHSENIAIKERTLKHKFKVRTAVEKVVEAESFEEVYDIAEV